MTNDRPSLPDRRQLLAGLAAAPLVAADPLSAQPDPGCSGQPILFSEMGERALGAGVARIQTVGRTVAGRFAASYRLDESQERFSAAGTRLFSAAVASGRAAGDVERALSALEARFRVRTGDGRWFILDESRKLAGHFGAQGDGRADDTEAIQALIDWHVYFAGPTEGGEIHLGPGTFRTTAAIHAPYGGPRRFDRVELVGEGMVAGPGFGGTVILCDHDEAMGINFQGARYGGARELSLQGRLRDHILRNRFGTATPALDDLDEAAWADPALPRTSGSRYAPYAGITIDAYSGTRPSGGYPAVDYPAWLPADEARQYGKTFSSALGFERVRIAGFNTGLACQPCDADGNGDFITLRGCAITHCALGISIGNTQSRNFSLTDCQAAYFHTFVATNRHGRQNGRIQGTWKDVSVSNGIDVMDIGSTAIVGPVQFDTLYAEAIFRLGHVRGGTSAETSMIFTGGSLSFDLQGVGGRGVPIYILGHPGQPGQGPGGRSIQIEFNGTGINRFPSVATLLADGVVLRGASLQSGLSNAATAEPWRRTAFNSLAGGLITARLESRGRAHDIGYSAFDLDNAARRVAVRAREGADQSTRSVAVSHFAPSARAHAAQQMERLVNPQAVTSLDKSQLADVRLAGRMLTFRTAMSAAASEAAGLVPGGILYDLATGFVFWVMTRRGSEGAFEIAAELQNGWRERDGRFAYEAAFDPGRGRLLALAGRYYTPSRPLFIEATAGSPVLRISGADGAVSNALNEIKPGDRLHAAEGELQWLPGDAAVVRAGAGDIVLAAPVRRSVSGRRLDWLRRAPDQG